MSSSLVTLPTAQLRPPRLQAFGVTDPGRVRSVNEDAYLVASELGLFAVADGVGGRAAGDVASRMTVVTLLAELGGAGLGGALDLQHLVAAVQTANAGVRAAGREVPVCAGMGTTLTALLLRGDRAALAHVGDSRAYRLRDGRLVQLSEDHTIVNACIQAGLMTREEARTSEVRHVIARAVGVDETVEVDAMVVAASPGDTFLLASDGLHGVVGEEEIAEILLAERDVSHTATRLVERANEGGGPDNVTVVVIRIG